MTNPLMLSNLIVVPPAISTTFIVAPVIAMIVLFFTGFQQFFQGHIGRIGIFANTMLLWQLLFHKFNELPSIIQWYLNAGTIVGLLALGSYLFRNQLDTSLPKWFYDLAFVFYGSISILIILFLHFSNPSTITAFMSLMLVD